MSWIRPIPAVPLKITFVTPQGQLTKEGMQFLQQGTIPLFTRIFLLADTTVGNDVTYHQYAIIIGNLPQQQLIGTGRRIVGLLKQAITMDLVVRFNNATKATVIGTITIPKTTSTSVAVVLDIAGVSISDLDVLTVDVLASDGSKNANGIASFTLEFIGSV